ncbi:hypothetical protein ACQUSR_09110 [Streptomyces sp. P1-3]|uniref:hypothetical protein n=1 Tax=Streptomyces sp. P1-3 TaxID=3421658 RepID=UPI003D35DD68
MPTKHILLAIDAKTTATGSVSDSQISFEGLREHRTKCGATTSVVIGPDFHPRVHAAAAKDGNTAILLAETLGEAVLLHDDSPFSPDDLLVLFTPDLTAKQRGSALRRSQEKRRDFMTVLSAIITQLDLEVRDDNPMYPGGWLGPNELRRDLRKLGISADVISQALALLSSPFVAVAEQGKDRFRLVVPPSMVAARLRSLAAHLVT